MNHGSRTIGNKYEVPAIVLGTHQDLSHSATGVMGLIVYPDTIQVYTKTQLWPELTMAMGCRRGTSGGYKSVIRAVHPGVHHKPNTGGTLCANVYYAQYPLPPL